ncbi:hypothetical protein [Phytohabitans aurantiacus]|uniref:Uncharacterized protein n=1 Tax=Phytohabitans aurantiacus TaxID=3016789 RepID=A0ABQ5R266_9ACTN|nr:hypothetical protein [Phytohabitans aurantiacus]GLI00292.1 hypothetical protein Pa4123_55680 [Phytohabitans aurantiacus]
MLEIDKLDLDDLAMALSDQNSFGEYRHMINRETGELLLGTGYDGFDDDTTDDFEEQGLIEIDPLPSRVWYRDMADFAALVSAERAARRLGRALDGRGAFRRFKAELHDEYPHLLRRGTPSVTTGPPAMRSRGWRTNP